MDKTLVLFTVSPTGLGHIRVMDALKDGLYPGVVSETIGLQNINASKIHKRLKEEKIFASMLSYVAEAQPELTSNGVKMIWDEINKLLV